MSATERPWTRENQIQDNHLGDYCDLHVSIKCEHGCIRVSQRITDTQEGYEEGKRRIDTILRAVNTFDRAKAALAQSYLLLSHQQMYVIQPDTAALLTEIQSLLAAMEDR